MNNNTQAQIVTTSQNARLLELVQNSRKLVHEGQIQICYMPDARIYFVMINTYCQTIFPSTPWVILKSEKGFSLLYPNSTAGLNGIFIQKGQQGDLFLNALQQLVQIIPFENAIQIPQFKQSIQIHCKDIDINPLENSTTAVGYIKAGGEALKEGFNWLGDKIAKGVAAGGEYINSKVEKKEDVEVKPETKIKVETAKSKFSQTVDVTGAYLKQLFTPVVQKGSEIKQDINKQIDNSDSQGLKEGREIFVATWDAMGTALTGLGSALSKIGDQIGTDTRAIVEKKYGQDVSETYLGPKQQDQQQQQQQQ
ncbi:unnamed protein product [Paramecium primaurelia]|uniref:Senescence domain-containing protein n=1 Tax=Paramecium primaurelia TaxID=5886 RepID=A0A8S1M5W8_PARPR|nr:unnamed protein product [Paramecium primaurelia]